MDSTFKYIYKGREIYEEVLTHRVFQMLYPAVRSTVKVQGVWYKVLRIVDRGNDLYLVDLELHGVR